MKIFYIKHLESGQTSVVDSVSHLKFIVQNDWHLWEIWVIEGRKGSELNSRLREMEANRPNPLWAQSYTPPLITRTRTPEHNAKISQKMSGRSLSQEHKDNISQALLGNQNHRL
jgi:hypothetical protein